MIRTGQQPRPTPIRNGSCSNVPDRLCLTEQLPVVGERGVVVDSLGRPVCITEVAEVRVVPLGTVDAAHAIDEGEGYQTVSEWRVGHEQTDPLPERNYPNTWSAISVPVEER